MRLLAALCLAVLAAGVRPDSRWKLLGKTRDITMWVDSARVDSNRADRMIGVWLRFDYAKAEKVPGDDKRVFSRTVFQLAIDCHSEMVRNLSLQLLDSTDRPVTPESHELPTTPVSFAAHPFGHGTFIAVCGWLHAPDRYRPAIVDTSIFSH